MVKMVSLELQFGSACALHRRVWLKPGLGELLIYILATPYEYERAGRPPAVTVIIRVLRLKIPVPKRTV